MGIGFINVDANCLNMESSSVEQFQEKVSFIWSVADLLRGDYKAYDYAKVILPFTVLLSDPHKIGPCCIVAA